jgi:hypothetical protein
VNQPARISSLLKRITSDLTKGYLYVPNNKLEVQVTIHRFNLNPPGSLILFVKNLYEIEKYLIWGRLGAPLLNPRRELLVALETRGMILLGRDCLFK